MRIIAGEARGRTLVAPRGEDTRPTRDFVREALFNILREDVPDARVLDLFAGSGAMALEAISRGAAFAALCDAAPRALQAIEANVRAMRCEDRARVIRGDWRAALPKAAALGAFDLVFLDPPYALWGDADILGAVAASGALKAGAKVVCERGAKDAIPACPAMRLADTRRWRDNAVDFFVFEAG